MLNRFVLHIEHNTVFKFLVKNKKVRYIEHNLREKEIT